MWEFLASAWTLAVVPTAVVVAGLIAFARTILEIRKLDLENKKLQLEIQATRGAVVAPTDVQIAKYGFARTTFRRTIRISAVLLAVLLPASYIALKRGSSTTNPGNTTTIQSGDCLDRALSSVPKDRIAAGVEAGMRDLDVIAAHQGLDQPFAIIFTDEGKRIGAMRMRRYRTTANSGDLFKIEVVLDAGCQSIEPVRNVSRGGNPRELQNWDTVALRFGGRDYQLRIGGEENIGVNFVRVG